MSQKDALTHAREELDEARGDQGSQWATLAIAEELRTLNLLLTVMELPTSVSSLNLRATIEEIRARLGIPTPPPDPHAAARGPDGIGFK